MTSFYLSYQFSGSCHCAYWLNGKLNGTYQSLTKFLLTALNFQNKMSVQMSAVKIAIILLVTKKNRNPEKLLNVSKRQLLIHGKQFIKGVLTTLQIKMETADSPVLTAQTAHGCTRKKTF